MLHLSPSPGIFQYYPVGNLCNYLSAIIYGTIWTHEQAPKVIHSFKCFLDHASILLPVLRANSDDQYHVIFNELLTFITQKVNWY